MSSRDKKLLIIVSYIGVVVLLYLYVLTPMQDENKELKSKLDSDKMLLQNMEAEKASYEMDLEELNRMKNEILPIAQNYYGQTEQEEFIVQISNIIENSKIDAEQIEFSPLMRVVLGERMPDDYAEAIINEETEDTGNVDGTGTESTEAVDGAATVDGTGTESTGAVDGAGTVDGTGTESTDDLNVTTTVETESVNKTGNYYLVNESEIGKITNSFNQNVQVMETRIAFDGKYNDVLELLKGIDNSHKQIVSSELSMVAKKDDKTNAAGLDPDMQGFIKLSFYQVKDVNKYIPDEPTNMPNIPKSGYENPFAEPSWGIIAQGEAGGAFGIPGLEESATTIVLGQVSGQIDDLINATVNSNNGNNNVPNNGNNNNTSNNGNNDDKVDLVAVLRKQEIFGFENGIAYNENTDDNQKLVLSPEEGKVNVGKKALNAKLSFDKGLSGEEIYVDISDQQIRINEEVEEVAMSLYLNGEAPLDVYLVIMDAENEEHQVVLSEDSTWEGWKEVGSTLDKGMKFPIKVKGIKFVSPDPLTQAIQVEAIMDSLMVKYLTYK